MKRNWKPILGQFGFVITGVTGLALTMFSLSEEDTADRLGIALGLILALIFVEVPQMPLVTYIHYYYYISFLFMALLALYGSIADELTISSEMVFQIFIALWLCVLLAFALFARFAYRREVRKLEMGSTTIDEGVARTQPNSLQHRNPLWVNTGESGLDTDDLDDRDVPRWHRQRLAKVSYITFPKADVIAATQFDQLIDEALEVVQFKYQRMTWRVLLKYLGYFMAIQSVQFSVAIVQIGFVYSGCATFDVNTRYAFGDLKFESVFLFISLFLPLVPLRLFPLAKGFPNWRRRQALQWLSMVSMVICLLVQMGMAVHCALIWSEHGSIDCEHTGAVGSALFILFLIWLFEYFVGFIVGFGLLVRMGRLKDTIVITFLGCAVIVAIILPCVASVVQLIAFTYGPDNCTVGGVSSPVTLPEAISFFVISVGMGLCLIAMPIVHYTHQLKTMLFGAALGFVNFGLVWHSFTYFANDSVQCGSSLLTNACYSLFLSCAVCQTIALGATGIFFTIVISAEVLRIGCCRRCLRLCC